MRYVSLFSGIEAATVAFEPLGWEPLAFAEIDPFPCAVLEHRYPNVPNLGDVREADWSEFLERHGAVDLVVGGSPCQSFSIAGGRDGLDGESRLMYEYIRAVHDLRPTWILWENVPGVFSIDSGRAFGILLDELENIGYGLAWRVLDAQFFGVAQRRRRVFLVGHIGSGGGAAAVLFDAESVSGNTQSSREKRKELAGAAGIGASSGGFKFHQGADAGGIGYEEEQSPTLTADWHNPAVLAFNPAQITSPQNGNNPQPGDPCHTLDTDSRAAVVFAQNTRDEETTYALQSDGSTSLSSNGDVWQDDGSAYTLNCIDRQSVAVAVSQYGDVSGTLSYRADSSPCADRGQTIVCMSVTTSNAAIDEDMCGTLTAHNKNEPPTVVHPHRNDCREYAIRRLTPMECERLQGFQDGWTDIPYRGGKAPDAARYKALGNSMAVPVMRWIGERIQTVDGMVEALRKEDI